MSLLLSVALAASGPVLAQCSWDRPGANAFQGDVVAAVDRYTDIPADVRGRLKRRMNSRSYDELVVITRDEVKGTKADYVDLRDMHFGQGVICRSVTRAQWKPQVQERGLVYCEQDHCIIVPTVCRNVSRITRKTRPSAAAVAPTAGSAAAAAPPPAAEPVMVQQAAPEVVDSFETQSVASAQPMGLTTAADLPLSSGPAPSASFESRASPFVPTGPLPLVVAGANAPGAPVLPAVGGQGVFAPVPGVMPPVAAVGAVPEPSAYALLLVGLTLIVWRMRSRRSREQHRS